MPSGRFIFWAGSVQSDWWAPPGSACGRQRRPEFPTGSSMKAITPSATWPRRSPCSSPIPASRVTSRSRRGSRSGCSPCAGRTRKSSVARWCAGLGESSAARQRFVWNKLITGSFRVGVSAAAGRPAPSREVSGDRKPVIAHRLMGDWEPSPEFFARLLAPDDRRRRHEPPVSLLPGLRLDQEPDALGDAADWQRGMEVGRHPRAADPSRRPDLPLVARRGADHRALSRDRRRRRAAARRHRPRRRDPPVDRRVAAALRPAPAADRPEDDREEAPRRGPGGPRRVRPAGTGRSGRASVAPRRAPARLAVLLQGTASAGRLRLSAHVEAASWDDLRLGPGAARGRWARRG